MSMIGNFLPITSSQLEDLIAAPDKVESFLYEEDHDPPEVDIDKAWHGIHWLLTGHPWEGETPWFNVVLGGTPISEAATYGSVRYLTPCEVEVVHKGLLNLPNDILIQRFDAHAMTKAEIYPDIWDEGDAAREYLLEYLNVVRAVYRDASERGDAMLLWLS
jgi:hypothetical protein